MYLYNLMKYAVSKSALQHLLDGVKFAYQSNKQKKDVQAAFKPLYVFSILEMSFKKTFYYSSISLASLTISSGTLSQRS